MALGDGVPGAKRRKISDLQTGSRYVWGKENGGPYSGFYLVLKLNKGKLFSLIYVVYVLLFN